MPWVRLDDQFFGHRKVADLSKDAKLLHLAALTHCSAQLTDGLITAGALRIICGTVDVRAKVAGELVRAELWEIVDENTYKIHDYLAYNPSANQVKSERAAAAQRQSTYRERHPDNARMRRVRNAEHNAESNAVTPAVSNAVSNRPPNPIPNPIPIPEKSDRSPAAAAPSDRETNSAREGGGGGGNHHGPDLMPVCLEIAEMALPTVVDPSRIALQLGPYRSRDSAWLLATADGFRDWANEHHKPFSLRLLGDWFKGQVERDAAKAAAAAATHSNLPSGSQQRARAAPPEPPPPQPASKFAYWKEPERDPALLGNGAHNGHSPPPSQAQPTPTTVPKKVNGP